MRLTRRTEIRFLTTSYRALSTRGISQRCVVPVRSGFATPAAFTKHWNSRAFSVSAAAREGGASDATLVQKLQAEIKYEKDVAAEAAGDPEWLTAFKKEKIWTLNDKPGEEEVTLERTFGNEVIRVMFGSPSPSYPEEEPEEGSEAEADTPPSMVRTSISIIKPKDASGALYIESSCEDGLFIVDNITYFPEAKTGTELSPEAEFKRRGLYLGPSFEHLDMNVQEQFESYLRERGIAEGLALFISEYSEFKEQQEYVRWLEGVKSFVSA